MTIKEATKALEQALETVGIQVYTDPAADLDPPAAVVSLPGLQWQAISTEPTTATYNVAVVVAANEHASSTLWDLLPRVATALDKTLDADVVRADPGTYKALPSYQLTIEVAL